MNYRFRLFALVSVFLVVCAIFVSSASAAQTGPMPPAEFREKFTEYMAWLDSNTSQDLNLAGQVQAMSDEEFQHLYDSFADPDAFIAVTEQIMAPAVQRPAAKFFTPQGAQLTTALFPPAYPSGSVYDTWVATLPGLGLLSDSEGDGSLANERCSTDGESGIGIAGATLNAAAIVGDVACNSIVVILGEGTNLPACIVAGVLHEAALANDTVGAQCSAQDGLVDSAEIEAAYENSKIIAGQADGIVTQLTTHDTEIKAALQAHHVAVMNLITANQAQALKIEIEKALSDTNDNKRLSYFYLPQARGGLIELVRQTVLDAISANQAAGISVGNALLYFNKAEVSLTAGSYKAAYDQYGRAYIELVK